MPMIVLEMKTLGSSASPMPKSFQLTINSSRVMQMDSWQSIPLNAMARFGFRLRGTTGGAVQTDPLSPEHFFLLAADSLFFADLEGTTDPMFVGANGTVTIWPLLATSPQSDPTEDGFWKVIRIVGEDAPSQLQDLPTGPDDLLVV